MGNTESINLREALKIVLELGYKIEKNLQLFEEIEKVEFDSTNPNDCFLHNQLYSVIQNLKGVQSEIKNMQPIGIKDSNV